MILRFYIHQNSERLKSENYKPFYLSFLRIAISFWLLKELYINWSSMELLYGQKIFIESEKKIIKLLSFGSFLNFRAHISWFIFIYMGVIVLSIMGIGRRFTAVLLFIAVYLHQNINTTVLNGGDAFVRLILFYLIFTDSYKYFTLNKNREHSEEKMKLLNMVSNLAAFSIMLQLCFGYFALGLTKLIDPLWRSGEATYYAMMNERFMGTPYNQWIAQHKWLDYSINYGTILFELLFPFIIWFKKLRRYLLVIGIIFHLCIYIFLMIYGFQIVFLLTYGLFLPNDQLVKFAHKITGFFGCRQGAIGRYIGLANETKTISS